MEDAVTDGVTMLRLLRLQQEETSLFQIVNRASGVLR